jgi:hypothetical protein
LNIRPLCLHYLNKIGRTVLICMTILTKAFFFLGVIIWEPTRWHDCCGSKIQPPFPRPLCWKLSVNHHTCQSTLPMLSFELNESKMNFNFIAGFGNCSNQFQTCPAQQLAAWWKYVETWNDNPQWTPPMNFPSDFPRVHPCECGCIHEDVILFHVSQSFFPWASVKSSGNSSVRKGKL